MSETIQRVTAALAGRYRIERELGQGGMATVYLAHDVRHDRRVALKVLRPELASILGGERFLTEIKTTANLQHPHILSLFDSGEADGLVYYVMPYVDGESLRDRLQREKQLPVDDAIRIAREVADALQYAHQHGIVHRDIKPENILLHGGHAMVADFGIALAASRSDGGTRMTETGMSLGTPHYMAPEQAMGEREITPRADIYALGCVTYEMLTAEPPFTGATAQAIIARVMTEQPRSLTLQRRTVPPHVEAAIGKALEKLPADRFATAAEFAAALADESGRAVGRYGGSTATSRLAGGAGRTAGPPGRLTAALPWALAALAAAAAAWGWLRGTPVQHAYRFRITPPDSQAIAADNRSTTITLSPDGRRLVYVGRGAHTQRQLYIRQLDQLEARPLAGTEGATSPFFSPDGQWVAFFSGDKLKKISLGGGPPLVIANAVNPRGGDWGPDGRIVFTPSTVSPLVSVSDGGGPVDTLTVVSPGETSHRLPHFLPGGKALVFTVQGGPELQLEVLTLEDRKRHPLFPGMDAKWAPTGHLLYGTIEGALLAVPFDTRRLAATGTPVSLLEGLLVKPRTGAAEFSLSANGTLAYLTGSARLMLTLVDRSGAEHDVRELEGADSPHYSPDGRQLVLSSTEGGRIDARVLDLGRGTLARITYEGTNTNPDWTPDGRSVVFAAIGQASSRSGYLLYRAPADGSGQPVRLLPLDSSSQLEVGFAPDGRSLVFRRNDPRSGMDLMVTLDSSRSIRPYLATPFDERNPAISPDGRYLAYASNAPGHDEVFVSAYPQASGVTQVSIAGGTEPRWARNGGELYYRNGDSVVSVTVALRPEFRVGAHRVLFTGPYLFGVNHAGYDVSPDNQRFAMVRTTSGNTDLIVAVNALAPLHGGAARADRGP